MFKRFVSILLLSFMIGVVSSATVDQVVVFGDSLSDNGNLYEYMQREMPLSPPYYKGRFSNGPVWIELVTAHYYPNAVEEHLLDYAFGGSGVEGEDAEPDDVMFTLSRQVDSFLLAHHDVADLQI